MEKKKNKYDLELCGIILDYLEKSYKCVDREGRMELSNREDRINNMKTQIMSGKKILLNHYRLKSYIKDTENFANDLTNYTYSLYYIGQDKKGNIPCTLADICDLALEDKAMTDRINKLNQELEK